MRQNLTRNLGAIALCMVFAACSTTAGSGINPSVTGATMPGVQRVVATANGYRLFINDVLVDTISRDSAGDAINAFANGRILVDKSTGVHSLPPSRVRNCGGGGGGDSIRLRMDQMNLTSAWEAYAAAMVALIAAWGFTTVADLGTAGLAQLPGTLIEISTVAGAMAASNAVTVAQMQLQMDQNNAINKTCKY